MTAIWHAAYSKWYDRRAAGNTRRSAAWGWLADRVAFAA